MALDDRVSNIVSDDAEGVIVIDLIEAVSSNPLMLNMVRGVAAMLGLDELSLARHAAWIAGVYAIHGEHHRDMEEVIEDVTERIGVILADGGAWDAYSALQAPSAYKYAAAVAVWLYLHAEYLGSYISSSHPLFSDEVAAAVARFLASRVAGPTIAKAVRKALALKASRGS
jgi:shikimate kinase